MTTQSQKNLLYYLDCFAARAKTNIYNVITKRAKSGQSKSKILKP